MKTILVSGFRAFGDYTNNSSAIIAESLHQSIIEGFQAEAYFFDGKFSELVDRGLTLLDRAHKLNHRAIISLGMDSSVKGLRIESMAKNSKCHYKYGDKSTNNSPVDKAFPYNETLAMDLTKWNVDQFYERCLQKGVPTEPLSKSAGTFCCNQLMFQVRVNQLADPKHANIPFIFIHIPCFPSCVSHSQHEEFVRLGKIFLTTEEIIRGIRVLLKGLSV